MSKPLLPSLSDEAQLLQKGIYEHYKGHHYRVLAIAHHSETLEECVVYQSLEGEQKVWVRPLNLFSDTVCTDTQEKLPRFKLQKKIVVKDPPRVGVGIAVIKQGKVLLGKRRGSHGTGYWAFPGGHLEHGETVEECVQRELQEEANLTPLSIKQGPWINNHMEANKHYVTLFMFVQDFTGDLKLMEPDKCEGWEWFAWDQLPTPLFEPIVSLIAKVGLENLKSL